MICRKFLLKGMQCNALNVFMALHVNTGNKFCIIIQLPGYPYICFKTYNIDSSQEIEMCFHFLASRFNLCFNFHVSPSKDNAQQNLSFTTSYNVRHVYLNITQIRRICVICVLWINASR